MTRPLITKALVLLTAAFCVLIPALRHGTVAVTAKSAAANLQSPSPTPIPRSNGGLPVVSPAGSRIAFVSDRNGADDVFVISVNGQNERQLTVTPEAEGNVAWTREGKILFTLFRDSYSYLYTIDADGQNRRELAKVPGRGVTLSPDGQRLLYMAGTWTASKLTISAPDGSQSKEITDGSSIAWNSHWSPDGKQLAFTGRNDPKGELAIFMMSADGSGRRQISNVPAEEGGAQWPSWSPDGQQLAFQVNSRTQKGSAHIWLIDFRTGAARKLAAHAESYLDETPAWFPDGKRLAFQSNRTGRMEVWTMKTDGSDARQVTGLKPHSTGQRAERNATLPLAAS